MKTVNCRACDSKDLALVYDFGPQPLAGTYPLAPASVEPVRRYPLDLSQCASCGLLQVTNLPPIEEVFNENYRYASSTVPDLVRHFESYADWLDERLPAGARILEFGCNDGVLLERLEARGYACTGVDASDNVARIAREKGLNVHIGFLTPDFVAREGLQRQFDAVTCSNVFAHIHELKETTEAVRFLLRPGGQFFIEVHNGDVLVEEAQFDTVYHEHLTYFTEATLRTFLVQEGFGFVECVRTPMHGGSLRFWGRLGAETKTDGVSRPKMIDARKFAQAIERCTADVQRLEKQFGVLDGYGAAGRAQMFVNITSTAGCFRTVYDDSSFRQQRYIVGTEIPIQRWSGDNGRCCAILAWNYAGTIADRVRPHFERVVTLLPDYREW